MNAGASYSSKITRQSFGKRSISMICVFGAFGFVGSIMATQTSDQLQDPKLTEYWEPEVQQVTPQPFPSDAIVLFDGTDLTQWQHSDKSPAKWSINDGAMTVKTGSRDIQSKHVFCDIQLHIEWRSPRVEPNKKGQQLGNSGVFMQQRYEVQILNSYENATYVNGQAASIYKQSPPLVNASLPAEEWQTYDIIYKAPTFDNDDKVLTPAYMTLLHNGILVQNHFEIKGSTIYRGKASYEKAHGCDSISLQDHGDKVSFRNIWVREL